MYIREEKGIAGTDIAISVIIITVFIATIGNLIININLNSQDVKRKTVATSYAVQEMEKIKAEGIDNYVGKGITEPLITEEDIMENGTFTGYHKTVTVKDYVLIKQDNTKQQDLIKEITVEVSYKLSNKEKNMQISTYITKE